MTAILRTLLLLLALASGTAWAGRWALLIEGATRAIYLDTVGLVREAGVVRTWVREVYTQEQRAEQVGVYYYSANSLVSYDCKRRTWAPLFKVFYGGDGTELRRLSLDAVDAPALASPGSIEEGLLDRACTHGQKSAKKAESEPAMKLALALAQTTAKPKAVSASPEGGGAPPAPAKDAAVPAATPASDAKQPAAAAAKPAPAVPGKGGNGHAADKASAPYGDAQRTAELLRRVPAPRAQPYVRNAHVKRVARRAAPVEPEHAPRKEAHWSYHGAGAPEHWGKLDPEFAACAQGKRQSPIDIKDGARLELEQIRFDYKPVPLRIEDNGHTVVVSYAEGSHITVAGERYDLKQFHFHKPSEERIAGRWFDLVAHLVHRSVDGRLAVVAVLFEARERPNDFLRGLWPHLPLETGREFAPAEVTIDATELLPEVRSYYTYMGSLTTPPCTEGVLWIVLKSALEVSPEQVAVFGRLYNVNARPVQPANGRLIKESM